MNYYAGTLVSDPAYRSQLIQRVAVLRQVDLFAGTPGGVLSLLAELSQETLLNTGDRLMGEGDSGDWLFVLMEGQLTATVNGRVVAELLSGAVVGEFAVFVPGPRSATVVAAEPCRLLRIERLAVEELLLDYPDVAAGMLRTLVRRFQARNDQDRRGQTA
jgi:CRP/FNR family transcriptional regulator, cyclic AMP receptor protein